MSPGPVASTTKNSTKVKIEAQVQLRLRRKRRVTGQGAPGQFVDLRPEVRNLERQKALQGP